LYYNDLESDGTSDGRVMAGKTVTFDAVFFPRLRKIIRSLGEVKNLIDFSFVFGRFFFKNMPFLTFLRVF
jgi:hypothetical protein